MNIRVSGLRNKVIHSNTHGPTADESPQQQIDCGSGKLYRIRKVSLFAIDPLVSRLSDHNLEKLENQESNHGHR